MSTSLEFASLCALFNKITPKDTLVVCLHGETQNNPFLILQIVLGYPQGYVQAVHMTIHACEALTVHMDPSTLVVDLFNPPRALLTTNWQMDIVLVLEQW